MLVHRVVGSVLPVVGIRPAARGAAVDPMALSPGHLGKGAGRGRVHWAVDVTGEDIDAG
jgi:hypothetical protein